MNSILAATSGTIEDSVDPLQPEGAFGIADLIQTWFAQDRQLERGQEMQRVTYRSPRPKWNVRSSFLTGIVLLAVVTPIVLLKIHESIWKELEIVTLLVSLAMFTYLWTVLYLGVRFDKGEGFSIDWPKGRPMDTLFDFGGPSDFGGHFMSAGAEAGYLGMILGLVLDVIVFLLISVIISALIWLGVNAGIAIVVAVFLPVFYFHRRSLRYIVARGRKCRGKLGRSALYALWATLVCTVWFYLVFYLAHQWHRILI